MDKANRKTGLSLLPPPREGLRLLAQCRHVLPPAVVRGGGGVVRVVARVPAAVVDEAVLVLVLVLLGGGLPGGGARGASCGSIGGVNGVSQKGKTRM